MRKLLIKGAFEIISKPNQDERGYFLNLFRSYDNTFKNFSENFVISQINLSHNLKVGTLRGLHYQKKPFEEAKFIRCIKGKVWDVIVDLREESETFLKWYAVELSEKVNNGVFIPKGCAHGFQVIEKESQLLYFHSGKWVPEAEKGIKWDDKTLQINWPLKPSIISSRDSNLPYLSL